jgi:hypothetical protein
MSKQVAQKAKKAREASQKRVRGEESGPTYGAEGAQSDVHKKNSEKRKLQLQTVLQQEKHPITLAGFVVNPDSFGETVENLFACETPSARLWEGSMWRLHAFSGGCMVLRGIALATQESLN